MEIREDGHERAMAFLALAFSRDDRSRCVMYLIPTPPATKTTLLILCTSIPGGGQTKLPPTLTNKSDPKILASGRQSHAAGGFHGDF